LSKGWKEAVDWEITVLAPPCLPERLITRYSRLKTLDLTNFEEANKGSLLHALLNLGSLQEVLSLNLSDWDIVESLKCPSLDQEKVCQHSDALQWKVALL